MNPETNRIEYKRELTDDLEKEAIAFLNDHEGGILYIGIDKTGKVVGVSDMDGDRDLDLVEHLGSGVPRILRNYGKECFRFTENFLRMTFPASEQVTAQVTAQDTAQVTPQVTAQVEELIKILDQEMDRQEIQVKLNLSHRENFRLKYLKPALEQGFVEMTIPGKPNSRLQKYRLTVPGKQLKDNLKI